MLQWAALVEALPASLAEARRERDFTARTLLREADRRIVPVVMQRHDVEAIEESAFLLALAREGLVDGRPTAHDRHPAAALRNDRISPKVVGDVRERLTKGEDVVDPKAWAGSIPAAFGIAPRLRVGANRWFNLVWLLPIGWVLLMSGVAAAQYLRGLPAVEEFVRRHPGTGFATTFGVAMPVWLRVQHFLNLFLLIFIIRAGLQILADHPRLYWTRHSTPGKEWLRMQKPVPDTPLWTAKQDSLTLPRHVGLPGIRHSIGLARWWHLGVDTLWLANGLIFYALLFATSEWRRIVPTSWQVFPDAASVLLQYLSLRWPADDSCVAYNGLQMLAYFITVFIAAPLALVTGLGMSPALSTRFHGISKRLSI